MKDNIMLSLTKQLREAKENRQWEQRTHGSSYRAVALRHKEEGLRQLLKAESDKMKTPKHLKTFYVLKWGKADTLTESKGFPTLTRAKACLFTLPDCYSHFQIEKHTHEGCNRTGGAEKVSVTVKLSSHN